MIPEALHTLALWALLILLATELVLYDSLKMIKSIGVLISANLVLASAISAYCVK